MKEHVILIPLGPVQEKLNTTQIKTTLNKRQTVFLFELEDPLLNLPAPTKPSASGRNDSPQYDVNELFSYMKRYRAVYDLHNSILIGIIDSEVYDELFSTIDQNNSMIVVSTRIEGLSGIIEISGKTIEQYVELEIGAQLLALKYRIYANIQADPEKCEKPWHVERRNCLFDYFGLSRENVQKLMSPRISDQTMAEFRQVELPQRYINGSLTIVQAASKTLWSKVWKQIPNDSTMNLAFGAILGLLASIISNQDQRLWVFFLGLVMLVIVYRLWRLRSP